MCWQNNSTISRVGTLAESVAILTGVFRDVCEEDDMPPVEI
jgi:hypothetical protein